MKKPNIQFYNVSERTFLSFNFIPFRNWIKKFRIQTDPDPHTEKMRRGLARIFQRYHTVQYRTVQYRTVLQLKDNIHRTN
jgi:hypothetical protein